jgi:hypothetical protein
LWGILIRPLGENVFRRVGAFAIYPWDIPEFESILARTLPVSKGRENVNLKDFNPLSEDAALIIIK